MGHQQHAVDATAAGEEPRERRVVVGLEQVPDDEGGPLLGVGRRVCGALHDLVGDDVRRVKPLQRRRSSAGKRWWGCR